MTRPRPRHLAPPLAVLLAVLLALTGCSLVRDDGPDGPATGRPIVSPGFPGIVQDQGNTVPLPDGRTLWIFADTAQTGRPTFFVTSSAGVADPGSLSLRYLLRPGTNTPAEFLPRTDEEKDRTAGEGSYTAIWPTGATTLPDGRILVAYTKYGVRSNPARFDFRGAGLYAWRYPGAGVGDLENGEPAERIADDIWGPADGAVASPVRSGRWVYFTQCRPRTPVDNRCYSLRAPVEQVAERAAYRWWTGTGWSASAAAAREMTYGDDHPGRNPPTSYVPSSRVWVTVDTSFGIQSDSGLIWVAPRPWGPWSRTARFALPGCTREDGCYTLNVHPADSPPGTLRISYATAHDGPHVRVVDVPVRITGGDAGPTVEVR